MKILLLSLLILSLNGVSNDYKTNDDDCASKSQQACISSIPSGFNLLKGYPIIFESKPYLEYSYVFTKGTHYMINLCKSTGTDPEFKIFDGSRNQVGINRVNSTLVNKILYPCSATGIYYIRIYSSSENFCGNCVLAFSRK